MSFASFEMQSRFWEFSLQFSCFLFVCLLAAFVVVVVVLYIQTVLNSKRRGWEGVRGGQSLIVSKRRQRAEQLTEHATFNKDFNSVSQF